MLFSRRRSRHGFTAYDVSRSGSASRSQLIYNSDDEFLNNDGRHTQPPDHSPILAGFHYGSKLFQCLSSFPLAMVSTLIGSDAASVLECRRRDRRHAPAGEALTQRLAQVEGLYHSITNIMDDCPSFLKLGPARR